MKLFAVIVSAAASSTCPPLARCSQSPCHPGFECLQVFELDTNCESAFCVDKLNDNCMSEGMTCDSVRCPAGTVCKIIEATENSCKKIECGVAITELSCRARWYNCSNMNCKDGYTCKETPASETNCAFSQCVRNEENFIDGFTCPEEPTCSQSPCKATETCVPVFDQITKCESALCTDHSQNGGCFGQDVSCDSVRCPGDSECKIVQAVGTKCKTIECVPIKENSMICLPSIYNCSNMKCKEGYSCKEYANPDTNCPQSACKSV